MHFLTTAVFENVSSLHEQGPEAQSLNGRGLTLKLERKTQDRECIQEAVRPGGPGRLEDCCGGRQRVTGRDGSAAASRVWNSKKAKDAEDVTGELRLEPSHSE